MDNYKNRPQGFYHKKHKENLSSSVVDPHHLDADPDSTNHPDADPEADPDSDFLFDPDPTFHPFHKHC